MTDESSPNDQVLKGKLWGCPGATLHSGTQVEAPDEHKAIQVSWRSFQKAPAALHTPLTPISERGQLS